MSEYSKIQSANQQRLSLGLIGGIMVIVTIISPLVIAISSNEWNTSIVILFMTGQISFYPQGLDFHFNPFNLLATLPLTFLRIGFMIMMMRLYQGKTTRKRTLIVGILSELQLVGLFYGSMIIMVLISPFMMPYLQIMIPVPLLLLTGFLIMHFDSPTEGTMWIEEEKTSSWWEKSEEEPAKTTESPKEKAKKAKEPESPW